MPETLTILLTDVVDSTQLNTELGDGAMAALWAAHDRDSRALMAAWRAREIGRSDGFLLLFDDVHDAIGFAYGYHRSLAALSPPLSARVGIHTGQVVLRQNDPFDVARGAPLYEVDGAALPLAARLMAAAAGGQTLLSWDGRKALEPRLRDDRVSLRPTAGADHAEVSLQLVSQGHWRFKGFDQPIQVFQVGTELDNYTPPADSSKAYRVVSSGAEWRPVRQVPHALPAERDLFVGRSAALRSIAQRFDEGASVVSLLGVGGVGKTRLSVRYARRWLGDFEGGAWFCDLSAAQGLDGIVYAVAQALDVPMDKTDPVQSIANAIASRGSCLVILDNFEQVTRFAEATLGAWLNRAPEARFIVTSREPLGMAGERVVLLDPLSPTEAEDLLRERMQAAGVQDTVARDDAAALRPLVELLDCLPLAIELAAPRARIMRPADLLARMGERFKLLAAGHRRQGRQSTLRTTLDWSWDLLSPAEQTALGQCSVFEGGFTLAAAEAVLDLSAVDAGAWVADVVQALVEKSLVRRRSAGRFDLLRSVHDYAADRLAGSGDAARRAAWSRHWQYFGSLDEQAAIADRCVEAENLVIACRRAIDASALDAACDALVAAWAALNLTGPFNVAIQAAQALYRAAHPQAMQVGMTALWVSGSARYLAGDIAAARSDLEAAAWPDGPVTLRARALGALGQLERGQGNLPRAEELLLAGLQLALQTGHAGLIARAHNALGILRLAQGRLDDAFESLSTGLAVARSANDLKQQAALLGNIGVVERRRGSDESARLHYQEALSLAQCIGDRRFEGNMRSNLGLFHHQSGHGQLALQELLAAHDIAQTAGLPLLSANVCCNLGLVEESLGDLDSALEHHRQAVQRADRLKDAQLAGHFRVYLGRLLARMRRVSEAEGVLDEAERLLNGTPDVSVLGLLACARAECAQGLDDESACRSWYDLALQHKALSRSAPGSELAQECSRLSLRLSSR